MAAKIIGFVSTALWGDSNPAKKGKPDKVEERPFITSGAEAAVEARLEELGYPPDLVRHATQRVGDEKSSLESTCRSLIASHPEGARGTQRLIAPREPPSENVVSGQPSPAIFSSSISGSSLTSMRDVNKGQPSANMDERGDISGPKSRFEDSGGKLNDDVVLVEPVARSPYKRARESEVKEIDSDVTFHLSAEELARRHTPFGGPSEADQVVSSSSGSGSSSTKSASDGGSGNGGSARNLGLADVVRIGSSDQQLSFRGKAMDSSPDIAPTLSSQPSSSLPSNPVAAAGPPGGPSTVRGPPGGPNVFGGGDGAPPIFRNMSDHSQQVLAQVQSRHAGVSHATVTRLLLKTAAALRQGLLTEEDRNRLHRHLEDGDIDLVHAIVSSVGCRPEPGMPLEEGEEPWDCVVCFGTQQEQGWQCPSGHRYCGECMRQHVESVTFPRCPSLKCGYELVERDFLDLNVPTKRLEAFRTAKLQGAVDVLGRTTSSGFRDALIRCPNPACQNAVLVPHGVRLRYECICHAEPFCTSCKQVPYHYHSACADVQQHRQRWFDWVSGGRDKYFGEAKASRVHEGQTLALKEGLARYAELEADEKWKESKCRKCPSCGRPVQKLEGCASMICGTDTHGGNQQSGCGEAFNWKEAERYVAQAGAASNLPAITSEDVRCRGHDTLHAFVDCGLCGRNGIRGPRFRCLNCPSFDVCQTCEVGLFDVHEPTHVFEIMLESDFAWGGIRLPKGTRVRAVRRGEVLPVHLGLEDMGALEGLCGTIELAPAAPPKADIPKVYEWQSDRGIWHRYDAAANLAIEDADKRCLSTIQVNSGGRTGYIINLDTMKQVNQQTGGSRPVRKVVDMAAARVAEDAGRAIAASAPADPYRIVLDDGKHVVLAACHLEPVLESRADAEKLVARALQEQEDGIPEPPPEEPKEDEGEDGADY